METIKCEKNNCKETFRKCANCREDHSAAYKNCSALKTHTKNLYDKRKQDSYADMAKKNVSLLTSTQIEQEKEIKKYKEDNINLTENIKQLTQVVQTLQISTNIITDRLATIITKAIYKTINMTDEGEIHQTLSNIISQQTATYTISPTQSRQDSDNESFTTDASSTHSETNNSLHTRNCDYKNGNKIVKKTSIK